MHMFRRFSGLAKKEDLKNIVAENFGKKTRIEELDYDLIAKSYTADVAKFSSKF
jgi:hypothetical protein